MLKQPVRSPTRSARDEQRDLIIRVQERERIARDLHDGALQSLYALVLALASRSQRLRERDPEAQALVKWTLSEIQAVIRALRACVAGLESAPTDHDLVECLQELADELRQSAGIEPCLAITADTRGLSPSVRANLVFIAREAVANILRHARAHRVELRLAHQAGRLLLVVRDDGVGFTLGQSAERHGHGLRNMAERARHIGADLRVASVPGRGTEIRLELRVGEGSANGFDIDQTPHR